MLRATLCFIDGAAVYRVTVDGEPKVAGPLAGGRRETRHAHPRAAAWLSLTGPPISAGLAGSASKDVHRRTCGTCSAETS
jgi:hypothetical protein